MGNNKSLRIANKAKQDEFYTQLTDIENECKHYKDQFKDKIIFCNCDDPYESNFFKYFAMNFNFFGLKKLIATCYIGSPIAYTQLDMSADNKVKKPYKIEINEVKDYNGDGATDLYDVEYLLRNEQNSMSLLKEDGDFRSEECVELLKQSDIVVTNPPFSLFREFVEQLTTYNKSFVIMGNTNALTYKEIFKLFKEDKIRTGYTNFNVGMYFYVPDDCQKYHKVVDGKKMVRVSTSCWFTNLLVSRHNEKLILYKQFTEAEYPKYENYDAINISTYTDIPYDYDGYMGVPVTFLDKYNPEQFEIYGLAASAGYTSEIVGLEFKGKKDARPIINGKTTYARIFIKRRDTNENWIKRDLY